MTIRTPFWRWLIADEATGIARKTAWLMTEEDAARYPGAKKATREPAEWRDLPESPDEYVTNSPRQGAAAAPPANVVLPLRLLVFGGRTYAEREKVFRALDRVALLRDIAVVIHGGARGADSLAAEWAEAKGHAVLAFPVTKAEWERDGPVAGPRRNQKMLMEGRPTGAVAFPGGSGTADMASRCQTAGVKVWRPFG